MTLQDDGHEVATAPDPRRGISTPALIDAAVGLSTGAAVGTSIGAAVGLLVPVVGEIIGPVAGGLLGAVFGRVLAPMIEQHFRDKV